MLKKKYILRKNNDFKKVFKEGKKIKTELFDLFYKPNNKLNNAFGFVVSLKISKKAVERNKIKRFLRKAANILMSSIRNKNDIIVITKPNIKNKIFDEIFFEMKKAFNKI